MMTASPRANSPSIRATPTGNRLLPRRSAATAPASMVSVPLGSSEPAIHFLRAVTGLPAARNQVQRAPLAMASSGCSMCPEAITMWVPPPVAILAASILVCMPPRDRPEPAAPAIASISGVMRSTRGICRADAVVPGRRIVEAVDVGQQHDQIGAHHGGDACGEPIIVAVADLGGRDGVVLVDDRHRAPFQKLVDGRAGVEIAPPLFGVAQRHQHLAGGDAVARQRLGPGARQCDLADRRGGLAVLELERSCRQFEHRAAERDGAGRDHQQVALAAVQRREIGGQRSKPCFVEPAGLGVDQKRGADLHDDAAKVGKPRRVHGRVHDRAFSGA